MGILRKALSPSRRQEGLTIVPNGARVQGDLMLDSKLHLDGRFEGLLDCSNTLVIGKSGLLKGRIRAEEVIVSGRVQGELICSKLHILAGGKVSGRISCDTFILEDKGDFSGERMRSGEQANSIIDEAQQLLDEPMAVLNTAEVTLDNLFDSLPTQVKIDHPDKKR